LAALLIAVSVSAGPASPGAPSSSGAPHWSKPQLDRLAQWLAAAPGDALNGVAPESDRLLAARTRGNAEETDAVATAAAIHLLDSHRNGCCERTSREGWKIQPEPQIMTVSDAVAAAVASNDLDGLFANARPFHPYYLALRHAYAAEQDAARRATLAANLDRWRWMPRHLGNRYLLVNTAAFEATLWENGKATGRWQVIVGKQGSPTPIFAATVTGVIFNPYWEIPASIVDESIGKVMREHPAEAAKKGYVIERGRYRQRPGPQNSLGLMKLVMPNPYTVYLHDTPAQKLFQRDVRAFSHGCIRVGDALGLAEALLRPKPEWTRPQIDEAVANGATRMVTLDRPIAVYITYFTAEPDDLGNIRYFPDIYARDHLPAGKTPSDLCTR
jgi:murein L,D-transpeptidase YcbB/YkuD